MKWLALDEKMALFCCAPRTGRFHQLRSGATHLGPIVETSNGAARRNDGFFGLHAWSIKYTHPTRQVAGAITCPIPATWNRLPFDLSLYRRAEVVWSSATHDEKNAGDKDGGDKDGGDKPRHSPDSHRI